MTPIVLAALSIGEGLGLGMTMLALAGAFVTWLLARERSAAVVETKVAASADATQRTAAQQDREFARFERRMDDHENHDSERFDEQKNDRNELRAELLKRFDKLDASHDEAMSELRSQRTTIALSLEREKARDEKIADLQRRQSGQLAAVKGGA